MTKILFSFFALVFIFNYSMISNASSAAASAAAVKEYNFEKLWAHSKLIEQKYSWGKSRLQISQRFVPISRQAVPVATMTTYELVYNEKWLTSPATSEKQITDLLQKTYSIQKWKKAERKNYTVYEGLSQTSGQLVKLYVHADANTLKTSLVSLDAANISETYYESEYLEQLGWQKKTTTASQAKSAAFSIASTGTSFWYTLFNQYAIAALSGADLASLNSVFSGTSLQNLTPEQLFALQNTLGGVGTGLSNNITGLSSSLNNLATSLNGTNSNIGPLSNSLNRTAESLASTSNAINNGAASLNKMTDPGTMAKAGAAFGAAFGIASTAGAMLVHGAWDLGVSGVKSLWNEISGQVSPELREKMTRESLGALDSLEPLSSKLNEISLKSNSLLLAMNQIDGQSPSVVALENEVRIKKLAAQIEKNKSAFSQNYDFDRQACANQITLDQNILQQLKSAQEVVKKLVSQGGDPCDEFELLQRQSAQLQLQLKNSREVLIDSIPMLTRKIYDDSRQAEQGESGFFGFSKPSARKQKNMCPDDEVSSLQSKISNLEGCQCEKASDRASGNEAAGNKTNGGKCQLFCESLNNAKEIHENCLVAVGTSASLDPDKRQAERLKLVSQNVKTLKTLQDRLAQGLCVEGAKDCLKGESDFSKSIKGLNTKVDAAVRACSVSRSKLAAVPEATRTLAQAQGEKAGASPLPLSEQAGGGVGPAAGVSAGAAAGSVSAEAQKPSFFAGLFKSLAFWK